MIWLSTDEAIKRCGIGRAWLFRLAQRHIVHRNESGEFELESLPAKFQARYYASLNGEGENGTAISTAETASSRLLGFSEDKLAELSDMAEQIRKVERLKNKSAARKALAKEWDISTRSLKRRIKALKEKGLAGLLPKKRVDAGHPRVADNQIVSLIKTLYLHPSRPTVAEVHRNVKEVYEQRGLEAPSYWFVYSVIKTIPPDMVARFRFGEREFDDKFAYINLRRKPPIPREWVAADHHQCDHYVVFPDGEVRRPWITVLQDICTNEILGFNIPRDKKVGDGGYPGSQSIGLALRHAIMKKNDAAWSSYGLFKKLYADLGRDFRSVHVRGICAELQIEIVHTRGYHGKSKGSIERWFGIMEDGTRRLPGYCGRNPDENPDRQKLKPEPLDPKKLLSLEAYESELQKWIVHQFHHATSRALKGLSPLGALQSHVANGFIARELRDERVLDLLLMSREKRKVQRTGIQIFSRFFFARELLELIGQEVEIRWDPKKVGEVLIYKDNRFVCCATNLELLDHDASEATLDRVRAISREQKKRMNEQIQDWLKRSQHKSLLDRAAAEQREQAVWEKHEKIAAGATADSVPLLIPKYAGAAKRLRAVGSNRLPDSKTSGEKNPWLEEQETPPSAEEIFGKDRPGCHKCGNGADGRGECFDCLMEGETECPNCGQSDGSGHRYCSDCFYEHDHTNPGRCECCAEIFDADLALYNECGYCPTEIVGGKLKICPKCHGRACHRFCSKCLKNHHTEKELEQPEADHG